MWHVIRDMWHMTCLGGWTFYPNFSSLALTVYDLWYYEDLEEKDDLLNDEAVYRTAPATPGLIIINPWPILSQSRDVRLSVPFHVIFFQASHWPSGHMIRSRPLIGIAVGLLKEHVHHLPFPDEKSKAKQSQSVSSKCTSFTCNFLEESHTITFFIKKLQMKDVLFEETDWLCFALLCMFHQEIAGDGRALWGDQVAQNSTQLSNHIEQQLQWGAPGSWHWNSSVPGTEPFQCQEAGKPHCSCCSIWLDKCVLFWSG